MIGVSIPAFSLPFIYPARTKSVLLVGLWLVLGATLGFGDAMVIATKADNGRNIRMATGSKLQIELPQAGAAGYAWEFQSLDPELFEVAAADSTAKPGGQDLVGAPVAARWVLLARKAGKTELRLMHYRPWEGRKSTLETFVLRAEIY